MKPTLLLLSSQKRQPPLAFALDVALKRTFRLLLDLISVICNGCNDVSRREVCWAEATAAMEAASLTAVLSSDQSRCPPLPAVRE